MTPERKIQFIKEFLDWLQSAGYKISYTDYCQLDTEELQRIKEEVLHRAQKHQEEFLKRYKD